MQSGKVFKSIKNSFLLKPLVKLRRRIISHRNEVKRSCLERDIGARGLAASDAIYNLVASGKPCLVGRFGSCELGVVADDYAKRYKGDITQHILVRTLAEKGGFYPVTAESVRAFSTLYVSLMGTVDILGSWCLEELLFRSKMHCALRIPLGDIEPYSTTTPWTSALEERKVLVVNPLTATIARQYERRELLFRNPSVLPKFHLSLYKPIYEFNESERTFESWFAALESMKQDISKLDFDVAILGCGPFGMPLGAFIKDGMRKQAVVMGGATQVWFGIMGTRWDGDPFFRNLYNENWVYPSEEETPKNSGSLENGCYWNNVKPSEEL